MEDVKQRAKIFRNGVKHGMPCCISKSDREADEIIRDLLSEVERLTEECELRAYAERETKQTFLTECKRLEEENARLCTQLKLDVGIAQESEGRCREQLELEAADMKKALHIASVEGGRKVAEEIIKLINKKLWFYGTSERLQVVDQIKQKYLSTLDATVDQQRKDMETLVNAVLLVDDVWDWETLAGIEQKDAHFFQVACELARKIRGE